MDFIQHIRWRPGIGDPSFMGWLTVLAYGAAAFTAMLAARRAGRAPGTMRGSRGMWLLVAAFMTLLCLNKQLDLQSLVTDIGRVISYEQGWYKERREFQKWIVLGILGVSSVLSLVMAVRYRDFWRKHFLLAVGLAFLITFIVVRAVSFHHVEVFLSGKIGGVKMNWFLELTGIALIWLAAFMDYGSPKHATKRPWKPAG